LTLSSDTPGTIRYFLVTDTTSAALTDVPNINSPAYTAPLNISNNVQVRARVFPSQTNLFPGPISSETYIRITAGAAAFSSASPIALFHNFTGGTPPATVDQPAVMMVWDNKYGRASMTNPPDAVARIGLNLRGHTSYGFAVEVWDEFNDDRDMEVLGLPEESDWIFYRPNAFDQVLIHNPVAQAVSSELGRYASRSRMVEVFTSFGAGFVTYSGPTVGNYDGVYVLEEKVKANDNRVNVPRLAPEETNAPAITGGYIFKKDKSDPEGDEVSLSLSGDSFIWVEPRMRDLALYPGRTVQRNYLINYVNQFTAALNGPNWTNPVTGYAAWIDVDAWIDHHIINSLTLCSDALRISAYLYKDRGGKLALGPIWDFDRSQGTYGGGDTRAFNPRAWRGRGFDNGTDFFGYNVGYSNPWMNRLFNDPDFWQRWIDRWQQLRREELSNTNLFRIVDQLGNSVREAQPRMAQRQTETAPRSGLLSANGYSHMFSGTYQGELDFLKRWYSDRVDFVDTNLLNPPVFSSAGGPFSNNYMLTITSGTIEPNSTIYYTLNGTDPRRPGGSINPSAFAAANSTVVTLNGNARVFARNYNAAHSNLTGPSENPPISSRWSGPTIGTFYASVPALRITEIMFNPLSPPPGNTNDADNFEFIEFKNVSGSFLNLQNFRLHGGVDFTFTNVNLAAGQHVVLVKNVAAFQSRYGTGAVIAGVYTNNLGNGGDHIALDGPLAEPILDFEYKDSWYPATDGLGFSLVIRDANAATGTWSLKQSWRPSGAANGLPGVADPPPPSIFGVLIAEALTHTDLPNVDMVELFNPTPASANIGGWLLTDDPHEPVKYRIPPGTEIPAGGYLTIASNQFSAGPLGFALSSLGDEIYLFSTDASTNLTGYGHGFSYGAAPNPVSFGRYVNSSSNEHFVLQSLNTLGTNNAYPRVGPVVISEIMYHPPDYAFAEDNALDEFIELQNITATNVPLYDPNAVSNTWRLRNAVDFDFPTNVVLPPDGRLLVVNFDPQIYGFARSAFVSKYAVPTNVPIFGPWDGKLDNGGETIELKRPDNPNATPTNTTVPYYLVEEISYDDSTPWPTNADGGGTSLQRIDSSLYGNDSMNWQAAASTAGQPNPSGPAPDVDRDGLPDAWELTYGLDPSDSTGDNGAGGDPDFDGANNLQEYMNGTNPKAGVEVLRFDRISLSNQMAVLEFNTVSGRTYAVEAVTNLSATNAWLMVTNGIPGNGGPIMVQDPVGPDGRFYRLRSSP
jgi:hypothetical protein